MGAKEPLPATLTAYSPRKIRPNSNQVYARIPIPANFACCRPLPPPAGTTAAALSDRESEDAVCSAFKLQSGLFSYINERRDVKLKK
jgi:hypothetical protein